MKCITIQMNWKKKSDVWRTRTEECEVSYISIMQADKPLLLTDLLSDYNCICVHYALPKFIIIDPSFFVTSKKNHIVWLTYNITLLYLILESDIYTVRETISRSVYYQYYICKVLLAIGDYKTITTNTITPMSEN